MNSAVPGTPPTRCWGQGVGVMAPSPSCTSSSKNHFFPGPCQPSVRGPLTCSKPRRAAGSNLRRLSRTQCKPMEARWEVRPALPIELLRGVASSGSPSHYSSYSCLISIVLSGFLFVSKLCFLFVLLKILDTRAGKSCCFL